MDLQVRMHDSGAPVPFLNAAAHGAFFYSAGSSRRCSWSRWSTCDKRFLHDILSGVRGAAPARVEATFAEKFSRGHFRSSAFRTSFVCGLASRRRGPFDARGAGRPAILSDGAVALPLSAGHGGAQSVHPSRRQARRRAQRHADADRLPPLADHRLSPGLRELPRLRLGARAGRRFQARTTRSAAIAQATPISSAPCARRSRRRSNIRCFATISTRAIPTAAWPTCRCSTIR